ncbi:MAG: TonB-dependent receptor plug domain-containing protein, partial [Erythrobacter sp.]|nr:TonB-dependent receptor plug domain-containing protein [Erythrobacter sp.]
MKKNVSRLAMASTLAFAVSAQAAFADDGEPGTPPEDMDENIIVAAEGLDELDFISGQDVYTVEEIQRDLTGQLGDLLTKIPGVSATSFTPGASRPILRGLDGERVRVLFDSLGTADIANTSADHATSIDPLTTKRIEVLRGPASLLFGSQAVGGVVNVLDARIPTALPEDGFAFDALTAVDSANGLRTISGAADVALGESVVWHVDASFRETDDVEIPGFQLSDDLRADLLGDALEEEEEGEFEEAEELREAANQEDFIPNSFTETFSANTGLGVILGRSSFGASIGYYDTEYGLVGNPEGGHHHGEEEGGEEEEEEVILSSSNPQFATGSSFHQGMTGMPGGMTGG